ncbi:unnamed protein product [Effrenium voratum]|uniref:Very-long-chain aldehyde decarbonylase CER1-like C-terminal domain-containing protein n=1 Tax=Effrenium voratum TaxID=2562239 RepID=A0AA36NFD3_9DINO|nr:unnamed protein product [Effrenium voratum]
MLPLQPITFVWVLFCRYFLNTANVQRYHYRGTQCATWCLPVTGHFYFMQSHRKPISDMIVQAVKDADDAGVKYLGLAHLNKAEFINQGGKDLLPQLGDRKIRVVHGNTLTAAAVWQALREHTQPKDEIVFAGSTSKIGRALCILLAKRGHTVRMITGCEERFQKIKGEAGDGFLPLAEVQTYEEGVGCRAWILGKWMEPKRIQARLGFSRALALARFWRAGSEPKGFFQAGVDEKLFSSRPTATFWGDTLCYTYRHRCCFLFLFSNQWSSHVKLGAFDQPLWHLC